MTTNVILDTDIWSDIDDALALAMVHALEDRGEVKLLAVTISTNYQWCAPYVDLINTFYGRAHVPIGMVENGVSLDAIATRLPPPYVPVTRYTQQLCEKERDDGSRVYPRSLTEQSTVPEAATLLRETLAAQPDGSVVIVEIGYHTNLARLIGSPPDAISPLDGLQLIARKVRLLVVMAGSFPPPSQIGSWNQDPEFNLAVDIPSAQTVFAKWPTPIVASGVEVGFAMRYPPESVLNDFEYAHDHPIAQTYRLFSEEQRARRPSFPCPHPHGMFDLTAVLYAARPGRNYFLLSAPGRITVLNDGSTHFMEAAGGRDRYLIVDEEQKARAIEAMVMLTSQPPRITAQSRIAS